MFCQASRRDLLEALAVLSAFRKEWRRTCDPNASMIPASDFHNLEISDNLELENEYTLWLAQVWPNLVVKIQPSSLAVILHVR